MVVSSIPGRRTIGRLVLRWVTAFGRAYHLGITSQSGQLSLLLSLRQEMSTDQSAVMQCGWEQRQDGSFHSWIIVWMADPFNSVILSALEMSFIIKRYTNLRL